MDCSSESNVLDFFERIIKLRRGNYVIPNKVESHWSESRLSIVRNYFSNLSKKCDVGAGMIFANILPSFTQELQKFFMVPSLEKLCDRDNSIRKYQLVKAFISCLLQLLYHKADSINPCKDRIDKLEKELRFLLTILGDTSLMVCDEHEEFQNLLAEFEAVANEAGILVYSLVFSTDRAIGKMDEGLGVVLNHIDLLKLNIMKSLNLLSSISRSAYLTPKTSVVDSLLILHSLIYDLKDIMNQEDNSTVDVKDQIKNLHRGLIYLQSSLKDIGAPQRSEIGELKEHLMRIGDISYEAEYLIISFLVGDVPIWYVITRLTDVNHKIRLIGTELQEITMKYKSGDFSTQLSLQSKRNTEIDEVTVGFEDRETYILDKLVGGTEGLQVISVLGMPGLGKTTLAKKLFNHPSVNNWFDKVSWCVVSQTYQMESILANIWIHIKAEFEKDMTLEEKIHKTLKGRRYLVVIDDIWDSHVLNDLMRCFPDDGNGSRILFTSRNKEVAPPNSIIYELPSLSDYQCWELLEKKVFNNKPCPPKLQWIGNEIARNCYGLPLAVIAIAGILSTMKEEKSMWEEVGRNLASYFFDGGDNSVMQILELSYKHLPEHLKPCFLYFGAFQEDQEIPTGKLMRLWIAEGFIHKEEEKSAEKVAEEYLMELIDKSLVMVAKKRSDGGVKTCVIHDLFRDLCLKRSEEENFLKFVQSDDYSIHEEGHRVRVPIYSATLNYFQHVRSFHGGRLSSPFNVRHMRLLRVLHFDYVDTYHIIGIEYLVYLRYLVVYDLPASIGSLVNLEYLRVETNHTVYLPPAIAKMMKLRYIHVGSEAIYDKGCNNSQKNNLEFLSRVCIGELKDEEMLRCSPHLRKLKCICSYQHFDISFLTEAESLNIRFYRLGMEISFPSNIKKLTLSHTSLLGEKISLIGRLENLEVLKLRSISFEDKRWDTSEDEFQMLRLLKLDSIDLIEWNVDSSAHFWRLERLFLKDCRNLQEIPSEIGELATLQLIEIKGACPERLVESAKRIQQKQMKNE